MARLGVIGGTGLDKFDGLDDGVVISATSQWGPSVELMRYSVGANEFVFVPRHGVKHSIAPHKINYRANIAALQQAGVDGIIAVNVVGGIHPQMQPGDLVVPDQIIDYTWGREQTFFDGEDEPLKHIDFTQPYAEDLRQRIMVHASELGLPIHKLGVHGVTQGPRLETAAEIQRMGRDGCDIVGMTGMPEAALCRELAIPYACIALVVNPAAGLAEQEISMSDIERVLSQSMGHVRQLLLKIIESS